MPLTDIQVDYPTAYDDASTILGRPENRQVYILNGGISVSGTTLTVDSGGLYDLQDLELPCLLLFEGGEIWYIEDGDVISATVLSINFSNRAQLGTSTQIHNDDEEVYAYFSGLQHEMLVTILRNMEKFSTIQNSWDKEVDVQADFDSQVDVGGDMNDTADAAHGGATGLEFTFDDATAAYGILNLDAVNQSSCVSTFWLDPNDIAIQSTKYIEFFQLRDGAWQIQAMARIYNTGGTLQLRTYIRLDSGGVTYSDYIDLPSTDYSKVTMCWKQSSGADDGYLRTYWNDALLSEVTGVDNDTKDVDFGRFGMIATISTTFGGSFYMDTIKLYLGGVATVVGEAYINDNYELYVSFDGSSFIKLTSTDHTNLDDIPTGATKVHGSQYLNSTDGLSTWHGVLSGDHITGGDDHTHLVDASPIKRIAHGNTLPTAEKIGQMYLKNDQLYMVYDSGLDFEEFFGIPAGSILPFPPTTGCPSGWTEYSSLNSDAYAKATTGGTGTASGSNTHTHTVSEIEEHYHTILEDNTTSSSDGEHSHDMYVFSGGTIRQVSNSSGTKTMGSGDLSGSHIHTGGTCSSTTTNGLVTGSMVASFVTDSGSSEPPYIQMKWCKKD